jgi:hypothetical protein
MHVSETSTRVKASNAILQRQCIYDFQGTNVKTKAALAVTRLLDDILLLAAAPVDLVAFFFFFPSPRDSQTPSPRTDLSPFVADDSG